MPQPNLKYIKLQDFTPGIVSYTGVTTQVVREAIPGVATETNTYRCIALPGGGLGPLPSVSANAFTIPTPAGSPQRDLVVAGIGVVPRVYLSGVKNTDTPCDEVHVGVQWWDGGSNINKLSWYSIRSLTPFQATLRATVAGSVGGGATTPFWAIPVRLVSTQQANVSIAASWEDNNIANNRTWFFPDPTLPTSDTPLSIVRSGSLFHHAGRVLQFPTKLAGHGSASFTITNEFINFTSPPLSTTFGDQNMIFCSDSPSGYGAWADLGDAGFVLFKNDGGAVVVQGDIVDQPQVTYQRNVTPANGVVMQAVTTPLGVMYCDTRSVYLWDGTTSTNISRQLKDGFFLRPLNYNGFKGGPRTIDSAAVTAAYWNDAVYFPNGYLYSTIHKSWWMIANPSLYIPELAVAGSDCVYLCKGIYSPADTGQIAPLSTKSPSTIYSWQSQHFTANQGRRCVVREIELETQVAVSGSTVQIIITNELGVSQSETFTLSNGAFAVAGRPLRVRTVTAIRGTSFQVRIVANSNGSAAAPLVFGVTLGFHDSESTSLVANA